jgi:tubulin polyglutamylase TTLL6/13
MLLSRRQKINHFPGMTQIGNKAFLADNLLQMYKLFPKEYNFVPLSFCLPRDWLAFERHSKGSGDGERTGGEDGAKSTEKKPIYIVKPADGCQVCES